MKVKAISALIQPQCFVAEGVFATKAGEVGLVIESSGPDPECMELADKESVTRRFDKVLGSLGDLRVYQYLFKRRRKDGLFEFGCYIVPMTIAARFDSGWLNGSKARKVIGKQLTEAAEGLRQTAESFVSQADFLEARILDCVGAWKFLRRLVNYDSVVADSVGFRYSTGLDYRLAHSEIQNQRGLVSVGEHDVKVFTLKEPPAETGPDFLGKLREIDCEYIVCTEWVPVNAYETRKLISAKTGHFHRSRYATSIMSSIWGAVSRSQQQERPEDMQKDASAAAAEKELGDLLTDLESTGARMGRFALTILLPATGSLPNNAEVLRAFGGTDAVFYEEKLNTLSAFVAALPGGHKWQYRSMLLTDRNYADMSPLFSVARGAAVNKHLNAPCLAVMETRQRTPYSLNLHWWDVFHTALVGQTGSGKSYSASWLIDQAIDRYGARVVIFDKGGSYRLLTQQRCGSYMDVGLNNVFTMGPFALPCTEENLVFLHSFVRVLMASNGYKMVDPRDDAAIEEAIKAVYALPPDMRQLRSLILPDSVSPYLDKWRGRGRYASLFDNVGDTLTTAELQTFDFEALDRYQEIIEPLLFYVFHRMSVGMEEEPGRLKIFLVDECWKFIENDSAKSYIRGAFKTLRKKNAGIWIATQSLEDLVRAGMDETVTENCGSVIFLPNPGMNVAKYREAFHLNEVEIEAILNMRPKCEWLLKQPAPSVAKILQLNVKPKEQKWEPRRDYYDSTGQSRLASVR